MYKNYPYLLNKNFLEKICSSKIISHFVKITSLNWQEEPLEEIQGTVISGNFNINGKSIVRRTGSITFIVDNTNPLIDINSIFSINKKIFLEIGLKNNSSQYIEYPIIWFPMGLYVISAASCTHALSGFNINLQLKDKMCLLNGECGGVIPAAVTFSTVETINSEGNIVEIATPIFQIIQELVNHFGKEDLNKILISDIDLQIKEVMKWTGSTPLYISRNKSVQNEYKITTDYSEYSISLNQGFSAVEGSPFEYGKDIGYIYTDFTYPGELVCDAGETVTSVLDKIISVLTNYEYFYDVYGNFIFRQIKNYLNNSQAKDLIYSIKEKGGFELLDYIIDLNHGKTVYNFNNSDLITSYSNTPQYGMIKNDFMIWGVRKNATGNISSLVRYHLAIDKKPIPGNTYEGFQYEDPYDGTLQWYCPIKYENKNNFPTIGAQGVYYYDKELRQIYTWQNNSYTIINTTLQQVTTKDWRTQLYFQGVAAQPFGTKSNDYYSELKNEWPKIYNILPDENTSKSISVYVYSTKSQLYNDSVGRYYYCLQDGLLYECLHVGIFNNINYKTYFKNFFSLPSENLVVGRSYTFTITRINNSDFKEQIFTDPMSIDYFLDFIDTNNTKMESISIKQIGKRSYSTQLEELNCVFEPVIPDVVLINTSDPNAATIRNQCIQKNQVFYQIDNSIYDFIIPGGVFNSCYEYVRQSLHQYTNYNENVSINCLPLYFLEPNTRIYLHDDVSGIQGDFIINSISFGLNANTLMSINATKALEKI